MCSDYMTWSRGVVNGYTKEYLTMKSGQTTTGSLLVITLADLPPPPKPFPKIDCPEITFWTRPKYRNFIKKKKQGAGAMNGNSSTTETLCRCCNWAHLYLQYKDGNLVMGDSLTSLSIEV